MLQNYVNGAVILNSQLNSLASGKPTSTGTQILVASDTHNNAIGMQIISQLVNTADDFSAVILAGDITNGGYSWEPRLFDSSLKVGKVPRYFVGGNHENSGAMQTLQQMGYKLLGSKEVSINGVTVIGQSDPTAYTSSLVATPQQLLNSSQSLDGAWYSYANLPDVVVVHELAQAHDVIDMAKSYKRNLTVVYGHDHVVGHKTDGTVTLVDCGTSGASGLDGVVRGVPYTFQILDFSSGPNPRLTAVLTLEFYDLKHVKSVVLYPIN
jgi:predicted phosphodiesterase